MSKTNIKLSDQYQEIFAHQPVLILVLGQKTGKMHLIADDQMSLIETFKLPKRQPQDKPGRFMVSGHGRDLKRTAADVDHRAKDREEFIDLVIKTSRTANTRWRPKRLIVLLPSVIKNNLTTHWPKSIRDKIDLTLTGNFIQTQPLALLKTIVEELKTRQVKPAPPLAARKILKRPKQTGQ